MFNNPYLIYGLVFVVFIIVFFMMGLDRNPSTPASGGGCGSSASAA